jgi:hypothetical protein
MVRLKRGWRGSLSYMTASDESLLISSALIWDGT